MPRESATSGQPSHFDGVRAFLGRLATVSTPRLPGHGPDGAATARGDWDDAVAALSAEVPAGAVLCGYSLGARLALGISRRRLDLGGLVLLSGHPGLDDSSTRGDRLLEDAARARALEADGLAAFADAWGREPIVRLFTASERDRAARAEARRDHTELGIAWSLRANGLGAMPPLDGVLSTRPYPVRLVTGERDEKFTTIARARSSPNVTVHVAPDAGHDVCLDAAPFVAAVLRGALS